MTAEPTYCQDYIDIDDAEGLDVVAVNILTITCGRLIVNAKGVKVEHIDHYRELDLPGCERVRVSWRRRR